MAIYAPLARYLPRIRQRDNSQPKKWQFFLGLRLCRLISIPSAPNIPGNRRGEANKPFSANTLNLRRKQRKFDVSLILGNIVKFFRSYECARRFWEYELATDCRLLLFFSSRPP